VECFLCLHFTASTEVYSEILKYNYKESNFVSFQRILTHGAKDIRYFSFGKGQYEEHFLAVANHCKKSMEPMRRELYIFKGLLLCDFAFYGY